MDFTFIPKEGDLEIAQDNLLSFMELDNKGLVDYYNKRFDRSCGNKYNLSLVALHHVFLKRLGISPFKVKYDTQYFHTGRLNSVYDLKSKPYVARFKFNSRSEHLEYSLKVSEIISLTEPQIILKQHISKSPEGLIITCDHSFMNTQLHLYGVAPYIILKFDENNVFEGANFSNDANKVFTIQTQAKTIVIIKLPHKVIFKDINSIKIIK